MLSRFDDLKANIQVSGYGMLDRVNVGAESREVAEMIGTVHEPEAIGGVKRLVPRQAAAPNTYSGVFGLNAFPFHTDFAHHQVPPRYLMLRCRKGFRGVPTLLVDIRPILGKIGEELLARAVVRPRRAAAGSLRLLRLFEHRDDSSIVRWDEVFLKPASLIAERVFTLMQEHLAVAQVQHVALVDEGDTLVVDNWRMLHARSSVPASCREREIDRVYLESFR